LFVEFDDGVRIPVVERIPLLDGILRCQLLRLTLPIGIAPLRLSTLPAEPSEYVADALERLRLR
jgi:hypothetical protein